MKKIVLTYGLIAGVIMSAMLAIMSPLQDEIGFDRGAVIGYTSMIVAFLLVFFGVRSFRDNVAGGTVSFGRAFAVGALIAVVASACYVATWQVIYYTSDTDFIAKYQQYTIEKARAAGASDAEIARKVAENRRFAELYRNPAFNAAITFVEPMPVGLLFALVSAGVLRRRRPASGAGIEREVVAT